MIYIDSRIGSNHLYKPLRNAGQPAELKLLKSADVKFRGDGGVLLGIELKTISDLLSSIVSKRLQTKQLPAMLQTYDDSWLVVQGLWRPDERGLIEVFKPFKEKPDGFMMGKWYRSHAPLTHQQLCGFLETLTYKARVRLWRTTNDQDTVGFITSLYQWWQKPWDNHRSWQSYDHSFRFKSSRVTAEEPSLVRIAAATLLNNVGNVRAVDVDKHFTSLYDMTHADVREWQDIPGIGKVLSERVVAQIRQRRGNGRHMGSGSVRKHTRDSGHTRVPRP